MEDNEPILSQVFRAIRSLDGTNLTPELLDRDFYGSPLAQLACTAYPTLPTAFSQQWDARPAICLWGTATASAIHRTRRASPTPTLRSSPIGQSLQSWGFLWPWLSFWRR